ncbi:hypothetical protein [Streptomyces huiliensis]|uniref:hypothetical protein n=1 Tax=Streptomyces huiliensis TaxID=2876027 RepID=UPI001CBC8BD1|nr:hypothetical protein [Streptomyces huiliensis]MBZ4319905.1 hypothetical protein [Streptomyces huiliensis]
MTRFRRIATIAATTLLLAVNGAVLASPAQAEADANVLGGLVTGHADSLVAVGALGARVLELPLSLAPLL